MKLFKPDETMLNNYIQNKLSYTETEQIELWLADHPDVLEDLELGLMFKQGMTSEPVVEKLKDNTEQKPWWERIFHNPILALSFTTAFALGVIVTNVVIKTQKIGVVSNPTVSMFSQVRGSEEKLILSNNKELLIQVPVDYLSQDKYTIEIYEKNTLMHQLKELTPEADIVSMLIPKHLFYAGSYKLIVINDSSKDKSIYNFDIQ